MKHHLAGIQQNTTEYTQCPDDVKAKFLSLLNQKSMDLNKDATHGSKRDKERRAWKIWIPSSSRDELRGKTTQKIPIRL